MTEKTELSLTKNTSIISQINFLIFGILSCLPSLAKYMSTFLQKKSQRIHQSFIHKQQSNKIKEPH